MLLEVYGKQGNGKFAIIDKSMYSILSTHRWQVDRRGYVCQQVYLGRDNGKILHKTVLMHRIVNNTPNGKYTDHINHNKLDNRKSNLRTCTTAQNVRNRRPQNGRKYKGIRQKSNTKKWQALIYEHGKFHHLGYFHYPEDAARAYNDAARKYFGEFAYLNPV